MVAGLFGILILGFGYSALYPARIFPGVMVGGVDLSNLKLEDAVVKLQSEQSFSTNGKLMLVDGQESWIATPVQLGLFPDTQASVTAAIRYGRSGFLFTRALTQYSARFNGVNLAPRMVLDQAIAQAYLVQLGEMINKPVIEASLKIDGTEVRTISGQTGRELDIPGTLQLVQVQLATQQDGVVPLIIKETQPKIVDLSSEADTIRKILSESLIISVPGSGEAGPWSIDPQTLGGLISFSANQSGGTQQIQIGLDKEKVSAYLSGLSPVIDQTPTNARFIFNDDTRKLDLLSNAIIGRTLDIEKTLPSGQ